MFYGNPGITAFGPENGHFEDGQTHKCQNPATFTGIIPKTAENTENSRNGWLHSGVWSLKWPFLVAGVQKALFSS